MRTHADNTTNAIKDVEGRYVVWPPELLAEMLTKVHWLQASICAGLPYSVGLGPLFADIRPLHVSVGAW